MTELQLFRNLSHSLNIDLYVKRDDLYPIAGGGSKARKLDMIIPKAIRGGCNAVVTTGANQSNHVRATAVYAARLGWESIFVIHDERPDLFLGNLKITALTGAELRFVKKKMVKTAMDQAVCDLKKRGFRPLYIWGGGHCVEGAYAFYKAVEELTEQLKTIQPDFIVVASGTGTTQAGLELGVRRYLPACKVLGVSISRDEERGKREVLRSMRELNAFIKEPTPSPEQVFFDDNWVGGGYEAAYPEMLETIYWAAKMNGLILDPTYTGKAFHAMREYIENGTIPQQSVVVFWHTGGLLNLLASDLIQSQ